MYFFLFIFGCIFGSQAEQPVRGVDPLLNTYSDYEDSIYGKSFNFLTQLMIFIDLCSVYQSFIHFTGLTWSSREPWIFASLSYDGRVRKRAYIFAYMFGKRKTQLFPHK
jgi:hypothetical protein